MTNSYWSETMNLILNSSDFQYVSPIVELHFFNSGFLTASGSPDSLHTHTCIVTHPNFGLFQTLYVLGLNNDQEKEEKTHTHKRI